MQASRAGEPGALSRTRKHGRAAYGWDNPPQRWTRAARVRVVDGGAEWVVSHRAGLLQ